MASGVAPLAAEHALRAPTQTEDQRHPSSRHIDHRWDRSRGIIFGNSARPTSHNQTWSQPNGIVFAERSRPFCQSAKQPAARYSVPEGHDSSLASYGTSLDVEHAHRNELATLTQTIEDRERSIADRDTVVLSLRQERESLKLKLEEYAGFVESWSLKYDALNRSHEEESKNYEMKNRALETQHEQDLEKLREKCERLEETYTKQHAKLKGMSDALHANELAMHDLESRYDESCTGKRKLEEQYKLSQARVADLLEYKKVTLAQFEDNREAEEQFRDSFEQEMNPIISRLSEQREKNKHQLKIYQNELAYLRELHRQEREQVRREQRKELTRQAQTNTEHLAMLERELSVQKQELYRQKIELDGRRARAPDHTNYRTWRNLFGNLVKTPRNHFLYEAEAAAECLQYWEKSLSQYSDLRTLLSKDTRPSHKEIGDSIEHLYAKKIQEAQGMTRVWNEENAKSNMVAHMLELMTHFSRFFTRIGHFQQRELYQRTVLTYAHSINGPKRLLDLALSHQQEQTTDVLQRASIRRFQQALTRQNALDSECANWAALEALTYASPADRAIYVSHEAIHEVERQWRREWSLSKDLTVLDHDEHVDLMQSTAEGEFEAWKEVTLMEQLGELTPEVDGFNQKIIRDALKQREENIKKILGVSPSNEPVLRIRRVINAELSREKQRIRKITTRPKVATPSTSTSAASEFSSSTGSIFGVSRLVSSLKSLHNALTAETKTAVGKVPDHWRLQVNREKLLKIRALLIKYDSPRLAKLARHRLQQRIKTCIDAKWWRPRIEQAQAVLEVSKSANNANADDPRSKESVRILDELAEAEIWQYLATSRQRESSHADLHQDSFSKRPISPASFSRDKTHAHISHRPSSIGIHAMKAPVARPLNFKATASAKSQYSGHSLHHRRFSTSQIRQLSLNRDGHSTRTPSPDDLQAQFNSGEHEASVEDTTSVAGSSLGVNNRIDHAYVDTQSSSEVDSMSSSEFISAASSDEESIKNHNPCTSDDERQPELEYQIPPKEYRNAVMASPQSGAAFWSHRLYKNPKGDHPTVYYCTSLETTERQAKLFLEEPVVGFDLEWEQFASLKNHSAKQNVSLVQIAAEGKIGLFHLACFKGNTNEELMPQALRTVLESPKIIKAGVNIVGDSNRMRQFFGIEMQGLLELSHLYRVVKYSKDSSQVNFKLVGLASQVASVLLLPLKKDETRVSRWSNKLNGQQTEYAAADAYAGFRLFHELERQRKLLKPQPPRPAFYETAAPLVLGDGTKIFRHERKPASAQAKKSVAETTTLNDDGEPEEFFDAAENLDSHELDQVEQVAKQPSPSDTVNLSLPPKGKSLLCPPQQRSQWNLPIQHTETVTADSWARSFFDNLSSAKRKAATSSSSRRIVNLSTLRAYHLWHEQGLDLSQVASFCRNPPLALTTVASYVMTAIAEEKLPFHEERVWDVLGILPIGVQGKYEKVVARHNGIKRRNDDAEE